MQNLKADQHLKSNLSLLNHVPEMITRQKLTETCPLLHFRRLPDAGIVDTSFCHKMFRKKYNGDKRPLSHISQLPRKIKNHKIKYFPIQLKSSQTYGNVNSSRYLFKNVGKYPPNILMFMVGNNKDIFIDLSQNLVNLQTKNITLNAPSDKLSQKYQWETIQSGLIEYMQNYPKNGKPFNSITNYMTVQHRLSTFGIQFVQQMIRTHFPNLKIQIPAMTYAGYTFQIQNKRILAKIATINENDQTVQVTFTKRQQMHQLFDILIHISVDKYQVPKYIHILTFQQIHTLIKYQRCLCLHFQSPKYKRAMDKYRVYDYHKLKILQNKLSSTKKYLRPSKITKKYLKQNFLNLLK